MLRLILAPIVAPLSDKPASPFFCADEWRRLDQISHPKRRAEYIAGHKLLRIAVNRYATDLGIELSSAEWIQPPASAPRLKHQPSLVTSISHSQGWALIAIASIDHTCARLGIDIELNRPRKNLAQLARYSFGKEWVEQHNHNLVEAFFLRWTQCESVVKASTKTLGTQLLSQQVFSDTHPIGIPGLSGRINYPDLPEFTLSIAGPENNNASLELFTPESNRFTALALDWQSWWAAD
ncbi:4'-phosphopantetheinyl transferase family protein [Simiduia agarivorans]|uniref:4'-phosphopantetheinyl transferase n=1 Tax=Simiduia agarivorans (strain DSM 21679 / JCM 13881 / BCRC 17597 / SA1) TaxID=1117647 RepID=K4KHK5_SIMAS|nr:4'-phosphopantetheinyl transferase [Simiduia agarivorans]AFU98599.1 4'-phosphopantetheinyl transferase [Simiduia agarivorans SA1 = DSM 21679]